MSTAFDSEIPAAFCSGVHASKQNVTIATPGVEIFTLDPTQA
jgi:hypothetical protein